MPTVLTRILAFAHQCPRLAQNNKYPIPAMLALACEGFLIWDVNTGARHFYESLGLTSVRRRMVWELEA
jgi:hypothetical protein